MTTTLAGHVLRRSAQLHQHPVQPIAGQLPTPSTAQRSAIETYFGNTHADVLAQMSDTDEWRQLVGGSPLAEEQFREFVEHWADVAERRPVSVPDESTGHDAVA